MFNKRKTKLIFKQKTHKTTDEIADYVTKV